jgi:hypothetical protein
LQALSNAWPWQAADLARCFAERLTGHPHLRWRVNRARRRRNACQVPTRIALSYLTFSHNDQKHKLGYLELPARMPRAGYSPGDSCCGLYTGLSS